MYEGTNIRIFLSVILKNDYVDIFENVLDSSMTFYIFILGNSHSYMLLFLSMIGQEKQVDS
jgi:hypothetical protein